jgi:four helix bundle protein
MQNGEKVVDIHERIYQFVIRVINLVKKLPKNQENLILINQITRSSTSMGANDQEADGTDSKKDFISKYTIVRKEGKETYYWLRIIADTNPTFKPRMEGLMQENKEIIKKIKQLKLQSSCLRFN